MAINDLRSFLDALRRENQLKEIENPVDIKFELAAIARKAEMADMPALLFKNVKGYSIPVAINLISTMKRISIALEIDDVNKVISHITPAFDNPVKEKMVSDGPVKENNIPEEKIDIAKNLPIPVHALKDNGPFISAGVVIGKDPESGRLNLSYNRMQVKGPRKLGIHIDPWRHLGDFYKKAEEQGKPLDIAIAIGLDPAIELAAAARVPYSEFQLAGALRGRPIELVSGETVDVEYPANAEIVIEGRILPKIREPEGPFAEFTGYYGISYKEPVVEVTHIVHRNEPIYRTIYGGSQEHLILGNVISREPVLYKLAKHVDPNVVAVHIPPYTAGFHAIISTKKTIEGLTKNLIFAALTSHINIKHVIIVDDDVNIYDAKDVMWAIATRVQGDKDIIIIPGAYGHWLDRTSDNGITTKVGIDATKPLSKAKEFERVSWKDVNLSEFI